MLLFPHAKINLGLHVLGGRPDGYHEIQSILYPIGLCDLLELIPQQEKEEPELSLSGDQAPPSDEENLLLQAYRKLPGNSTPPPRIHLHKRIPAGAGLGGGSSDAAQLLRFYAKEPSFDPFNPNDPISKAAAGIGSDVPFFLQDAPVLVSGRGERMKPLELGLGGYSLFLIVPPLSVGTGKVYKELGQAASKGIESDRLIRTQLGDWKDLLQNDLEEPAFRLHPELAELKGKLYKAGAEYAAMTGSGSGVYGLFKKDPPEIRGLEEHFVWKEELPSLT